MIKDSTRDDLMQEISTTPGFIPPPEMSSARKLVLKRLTHGHLLNKHMHKFRSAMNANKTNIADELSASM